MFSDEGLLKKHAVDSGDYISDMWSQLSGEISEEINKEILNKLITVSVNIINRWPSPTTAT